MLDIKPYEDEIRKICAGLHLKRLALFGSVLTNEFGPGSDIDVLVEFDIQKNDNLFDTYFALKESLENIFHRPVDVVVERSVKNPFLKQAIDSTRRTIYAR